MQMEAKQVKKKERKRMRGGLPLLWSLLFYPKSSHFILEQDLGTLEKLWTVSV